MNPKKMLALVCLAAVSGVGVVTTAGAVTCQSVFSTAWVSTVKCAAPNAGKGRSVGSGTVGGASQIVTAHLDVATAGGSSDRASASGHLSNNAIAIGQFNACRVSDTSVNGVGASTIGGSCQDFLSGQTAIKHRLEAAF